ncbi:MAG: hypothetical protein WBX00_15230, partial [Isosphaeraceae bacterium]
GITKTTTQDPAGGTKVTRVLPPDQVRAIVCRLDQIGNRRASKIAEIFRDSSLISTAAPRVTSQVVIYKGLGCHAHVFVSMSQRVLEPGHSMLTAA